MNTTATRRDPFADHRLLVLLASYRDRELPKTVAHALSQAAYPEHVRFAICHQYDEENREALAAWEQDPRFTIDAVPFAESRGCCWARARTFRMYDDEPYILQVDAHTRFAPRWDVRYPAMLESIDAENPVLTTYPAPYSIDAEGNEHFELDRGAHRLVLERLNPDLTTRQTTVPVENAVSPGPSALLAAGQVFARGSFCRDLPYDPDLYFSGEEISLAVRAFTHGYDLYFPHENLVWHRYNHDERLHWQDNPETQARSHEHAARRLHSLFLGDDDLAEFGLGSVRSLSEFEEMSGIDFSNRPEMITSLCGRLALDTSGIDFGRKYDSFVFALFADDGSELFRRDITAREVLDGAVRTIDVDAVDLAAVPTSYILWPVFDDGTFAERRSYPLASVLDQEAKKQGATERFVHSAGTTISIDRSVIEPRQDYVAFVVVFLDAAGHEVERVEVRRPDVLDLSTGTVELHDLDTTAATDVCVIPTRIDGALGVVRCQKLEQQRDG